MEKNFKQKLELNTEEQANFYSNKIKNALENENKMRKVLEDQNLEISRDFIPISSHKEAIQLKERQIEDLIENNNEVIGKLNRNIRNIEFNKQKEFSNLDQAYKLKFEEINFEKERINEQIIIQKREAEIFKKSQEQQIYFNEELSHKNCLLNEENLKMTQKNRELENLSKNLMESFELKVLLLKN